MFTKVISIISRLSGDIENNILKTEDFCRFVVSYGYVPYAPHLLFTRFMDDTVPEERAAAIKMGEEMLKRVDEIWVFDENGISQGMAGEIQYAKKLGLPINYFRMPQNTNPDDYIPIAQIDSKSSLILSNHAITHNKDEINYE